MDSLSGVPQLQCCPARPLVARDAGVSYGARLRYAARGVIKKAITGTLLKRLRFEPQTLAVAAAVYGGFGLITWYFHPLPLYPEAFYLEQGFMAGFLG